MPTVHPRRGRARAAVAAALVALPALCLALDPAADRAYPGWDDYELAVVLDRVRGRAAESPGRPLELVLGSSRAMNAFDAGLMSADPAGPVVVNASLVGSTPLDSLVELRRVLAEGLRPRGVTLEVIPIWLRKFGEVRAVGPRHRAADLPSLGRVFPDRAAGLWREWAALNACRWHTLRADLMAEALPAFAPRDRLARRAAREAAVTPHGWYPVEFDPVPPEVYAKGLAVARSEYEAELRELGDDNPAFEAAMGEFFALCRAEGVAVRAVVFTPEGSGFRAFYGPGVLRRTADRLGGLCRRHGTRLIDAREWMPDDGFLDGHHMTARGGHAFTRRFLRETRAD